MKRVMMLACMMAMCISMRTLAFSLPPPAKKALPNGLTIYFLRQSDVPLVTFQLLIPGAGAGIETTEEEGLADLAATLVMKGTKNKNAAQVAEALDFLGASLDMAAADEYTIMEGGALREHFPKLMRLASECLLQPSFIQEEFAKERDRRIDEIKSLKDNPSRAVHCYFRKAYFGSHPLGHLSVSNEKHLAQFTERQVRGFYEKHYQPAGAVMAVVGDITEKEAMDLLEETFAKWSNTSAVPAVGKLPPLPPRQNSLFLLVDKPDATQAYFILGAPGWGMGDARTPQADVMNTLFGGRFTSRLNNELRVLRGLTYGARSGMQPWKEMGLFTVSSYTRNEKIGEMIEITLDLIDKARQQGFSNDEITSSRNYIQGQFPPTLEAISSKASAYITIHFYELGMDYHQKYMQNIQKVQAEMAKQIAQELLPKEPYVLVVVGKADEIRGQLSRFGSFVEKRISEPGF